jgi:hypothetical protein
MFGIRLFPNFFQSLVRIVQRSEPSSPPPPFDMQEKLGKSEVKQVSEFSGSQAVEIHAPNQCPLWH